MEEPKAGGDAAAQGDEPQDSLEPAGSDVLTGPTRDQPIEGFVAQILNSRELVINRGGTHGVEKGMVFEILASQAQSIRDPETNEVLGSVDRPKVVVRVVQVEPRMSVARTFRSRRRNVGGFSALSAFDKMFQPPKYQIEYDTLKTSESTWEDLDESESFVKTGDRVRESLKYDEA
jgi:hypothetical protein